jgi:hypothetical protein
MDVVLITLGETMSKIYLIVPYVERQSAKSLGARWDEYRSQWYVPLGKDYRKFARWLPKTLKEWAK